MNVVLNGFPVNSWTFISVAFILVLSKPCLQNYHSHCPDITFVSVSVRLTSLKLQRISELWRKVNMRSWPFSDKSIIIALWTSWNRIKNFNNSFLWYQNGAWPESLMFNCMLLKMTKSHNAACKDRPKLFFLKFSLLSISFIDFIFQSSLGKLKKSVNFVKGWTILIFHFCDDFLQRNYVFTAI